MGRLLGCIGCFFTGSGCFFQATDHILTQLGRGMERLHLEGPKSYPHPIRERNGKAPWLHRFFFQATDHILTQLGRGMGRFPWLQRLLFPGHRSYPHPIRERNGKAGLHQLLLPGHRSYPHPIRERNGKAPWLQRLLFPGHRSYPRPMRERNGKVHDKRQVLTCVHACSHPNVICKLKPSSPARAVVRRQPFSDPSGDSA